MPNRSEPVVQSRKAAASSSCVRATKFHHMATSSRKGTPRSRSARAGPSGGDGQFVGPGGKVGHGSGCKDGAGRSQNAGHHHQAVLVCRVEGEDGGAPAEVELDSSVVSVASSG